MPLMFYTCTHLLTDTLWSQPAELSEIMPHQPRFHLLLADDPTSITLIHNTLEYSGSVPFTLAQATLRAMATHSQKNGKLTQQCLWREARSSTAKINARASAQSIINYNTPRVEGHWMVRGTHSHSTTGNRTVAFGPEITHTHLDLRV